MRKVFFVLALVMLITSGLFAQANVRNNWISGELSFLGVGARYERMLNEHWSIGGNVYYNFLLFWNDLGIDFSARYYIWKGLHVGLALGYHWHTGIYDEIDGWAAINGVGITPEIGWKIDVGKEGGFFISPGIKTPITLGVYENIIAFGKAGDFGVGFAFIPFIGLGGSF